MRLDQADKDCSIAVIRICESPARANKILESGRKPAFSIRQISRLATEDEVDEGV